MFLKYTANTLFTFDYWGVLFCEKFCAILQAHVAAFNQFGYTFFLADDVHPYILITWNRWNLAARQRHMSHIQKHLALIDGA